MDREDAIKWVRNAFQGYWPNNTKNPFPNGWRWVVSHNPHQDYTYKLINANHDEINQEDVQK